MHDFDVNDFIERLRKGSIKRKIKYKRSISKKDRRSTINIKQKQFRPDLITRKNKNSIGINKKLLSFDSSYNFNGDD